MLTQKALFTLMDEFGDKGYFFHSEGDFRFQLGMRIHKLYDNDRAVICEYPTTIYNKRMKIDITLWTPEGVLPIELKYQLKQGHTNPANAANAFFEDVWRVEQLLFSQNKFGPVGYVIFLTENSKLWIDEFGGNARDFTMREGNEISGKPIWWANEKMEIPHKGMWSAPSPFQGSYPIVWRDYNKADSLQSGAFKYTVVEVNQP